jgi:hypothetical protein
MRGRPGRYNVPEVMRGPRFTSTGPVQEPPPLASLVSQLGPPFCGPRAEPRCDGCGRNFSIVARRGADGEETADGGKCGGNPAGDPGRNRYTVQRSLRWLSRTAVRLGPTPGSAFLCRRSWIERR